MTFSLVMMTPWFAAAGLAAVGLALWMHLYERVASRRLPISSLRLVPETPQIARSRRRIRHWPLFLLRALGVLLLGAAFARPQPGTGRPSALNEDQATIGGEQIHPALQHGVWILEHPQDMSSQNDVEGCRGKRWDGRITLPKVNAHTRYLRF